MDQALLTPLNQLESSLNTLLTSLTTTNTYAAAPGAAQSLINADDTLSTALTQLKQHQENHTRILALRAEADRLQTQLRDIVRTCMDLRTEIGQIHPSILEDTDDDDEDDEPSPAPSKPKRENKPVDYDTLLSFAARIGKHNAAAAIEAERQSNSRHADRSKPQDSQGVEESGNATEESLAALAAINDMLAQQRAYQGMAFPSAEALRMGELGRLQYLREQEGEQAVEKEVERMVRESEKVVAKEDDPDDEMEDVSLTSVKAEAGAAGLPERPSFVAATQRPPQPQIPLPPKPKVTLDLDFPGSDDDDDD